MALSSLPQLARNTGRFSEVIAILAKYGIAPWLQNVKINWLQQLFVDSTGKDLKELKEEERVRLALTELGTTFIKLGQILSTRPDIVGPELSAELQKLQSQTPADPPEKVAEVIEAELGAPAEELFEKFDFEALASASIGQVHLATLKNGHQVVVKVQHPGIEDRIRNDLEIMQRLAEIAEQYSSELRQYQPVETTAEFSRTLLAELDFNREQRNLQLFNRNFANQDEVCIPNSYPELSSQRVLTMDRLEGISVSHKGELQQSGYDLNGVAIRGANLFLEMIFRDGFYHADPHPGNLMVLSGGTIGLLDCGMVGRIDRTLREQFEDLLISAVKGDSRTLCEGIMRIGFVPSGFDSDRLQADLEEFLIEYAGQSLKEFDLSGALNGMMDIIRKYQIILPSRVSLLIKVLVMLEGTAQNLNPNFNLAELLEPWEKKLIKQRFSPENVFDHLQRSWRDWTRFGEALPRDLAEILSQIKRGRFDVHLEHRRLEQTVNRLVLGILAAALFVGSAQILSMQVPPMFYGVSVPGSLGCIGAVILGFRLIKAIRSTGNLEKKD